MKKFLMMAAVFMTVSMSACSSAERNTASTDEDQKVEQTQAYKPHNAGDHRRL